VRSNRASLYGALFVLALAAAQAQQTPSVDFSYTISSGAITLVNGGTVLFGDSALNASSQVTLTITNTGNVNVSLRSILVTGAEFSPSGTPLPGTTLGAGMNAQFSIVFTPAVPGNRTGTLQIDVSGTRFAFALSGVGIGPALSFSYQSGGVTTPIKNFDTLLFSPAAVGNSSTVRVTVTNGGTGPGTVTSIGVSNSPQFALANVPNLPATIDPGASISFDVSFGPNNTGIFSAQLKINALTFNLSGVGTAPPPLPDYTFESDTTTPDAFQQPAIGLKLSASYPLAIRGKLTLTFTSSAFAIDPTVQFSTGGKTVDFTIPANTTNAVFPNNDTQVHFQTGTVSGTIRVTPSFATETGYNLTPDAPTVLSSTIPEGPPHLVSVQITNKTGTTLTVGLTGFATGRKLTEIRFHFAPASGALVQPADVSSSVEPVFSSWYGSTQSHQFGSLFTASVPFTLQSNQDNNTNLLANFQSVSVSITNSLGSSSSISANLNQ
jgi:hypothetical protein